MLITVYNSLKVLEIKQLRQLAREFGITISNRQNKEQIMQRLLLKPYQVGAGLFETEELDEAEIEPEFENEIEAEFETEPEFDGEFETEDEVEIEPETEAEIERLKIIFDSHVLETMYANIGLQILKLAKSFPSLRPKIIELLQRKLTTNSLDITQILFGHYNSVSSLSWKIANSDEQAAQLVSGSYDGTIRIWNIDSGTSKIFYIDRGDDPVIDIAFNPDGSNLVLQTSHTNTYISPFESYDGYEGEERSTILILDFTAKKIVSVINPEYIVNSLAWNSDGTKLAFGFDDGDVAIFRQEFQSMTYKKIHSDYVRAVAWDPHNKDRLATGSADTTVVISIVSDTKEKPIIIDLAENLNGNSRVDSLAWHPIHENILAIGGSFGFIIWHVAEARRLFNSDSGLSIVNQLAWDPTGARLALVISDYFAESSNIIRIWRPNENFSAGSMKQLSGHKHMIHTIAWNPILGSNQLASGSDDGTIIIWEVSE